MNLFKPFYYLALLFSEAASIFAGNSGIDDCYKINCNAGKNSKSNSYNGEPVANYKSMKEYNRCGLNGTSFTINCDSKLGAFLNLRNCIAQNILPKKQCPPLATGKKYYPIDKGFMDIKDLPKGCNAEYQKKYINVKSAISEGKKGKPCI